eukprot:11780906-Alexandrium_andersonii.AAC.1
MANLRQLTPPRTLWCRTRSPSPPLLSRPAFLPPLTTFRVLHSSPAGGSPCWWPPAGLGGSGGAGVKAATSRLCGNSVTSRA